MSDATLNGQRILRAEVRIPIVGAWQADVEVDAAEAITGAATLAFAGGLSFVGTVVHGGVFVDKLSVHLVGGAGGLRKVLAPKGYSNVTAAVPIADVMADSGEQLAGAAPSTFLPHWARIEGSAGAALDALAAVTGTRWRVQPDGKVRMGVLAWGELGATPYDLLASFPDEQRAVLGVEAPWLLPGVKFQGLGVRYVIHKVEPGSTRTELFLDAA